MEQASSVLSKIQRSVLTLLKFPDDDNFEYLHLQCIRMQ